MVVHLGGAVKGEECDLHTTHQIRNDQFAASAAALVLEICLKQGINPTEGEQQTDFGKYLILQRDHIFELHTGPTCAAGIGTLIQAAGGKVAVSNLFNKIVVLTDGLNIRLPATSSSWLFKKLVLDLVVLSLDLTLLLDLTFFGRQGITGE